MFKVHDEAERLEHCSINGLRGKLLASWGVRRMSSWQPERTGESQQPARRGLLLLAHAQAGAHIASAGFTSATGGCSNFSSNGASGRGRNSVF